MAISPLLSIAGDVVEQITDGLSFQRLLGRHDPSSADAANVPVGHPATEFLESPEAFSRSPKAAQLEAIRRQPLKELEAYVDRLRERLLAAGIDLSEAIPLKVGNRGDIQVDDNHPDRAAIEDLLASDSQLATTFRLLSNALANQYNAASGNQLSNEFRLTIEASNFKMEFL
ncbi:MAG TPA: hypothetical protein QF564_08730 [Pirellulaceae bacterium]|jgi:hypothetical protein|nr:hypothetical protein [Pirellulaceae bacterium]